MTLPCKDCLIFPMCLAYVNSSLIINNAVLYIAIQKCSTLRDYIYHIAPDHPEGLDSEKYNNVVNYYFGFERN